MKKKQNAKEIARIFEEKINDVNLISDLFEYLQFDCGVRAFVDSSLLDESIRSFYESKSMDDLIRVIDLLQKGKELSCMEETTFINNVKEYIDAHSDENETVEEIAKRFHISYYHLCHLFKKLVHKSVHQYRTENRLEKAIHLLSESDDKISDIAVKCGFDNFSYFTEIFVKYIGIAPSEFRKNCEGWIFHPFYTFEDVLLSIKLQSVRFIERDKYAGDEIGVPYVHVHDPGEELGAFLHEAAIMSFEGVLYASWYNCKEKELVGYTPIVERRSYDGGETWGDPRIVADDPSGEILYCPPVYGVCDGKLYMLLNQMVSADHMHALDLYVLNKQTDLFELVWSRPIPFKLNTNVIALPNGKLILPGRIAELDGFPNTPAVMISDSGKIDAEWRVVKVAENGNLPDGSSLVHPETTLVCCDSRLYLFNRNDKRTVPLVYVSDDFGESWSDAMAHDIPYRSTKIYSGQLSDGRFYLIGNTERSDRSRLELFISEPNEMRFVKRKLLIDCENSEDDIIKCHYPAAVEKDGALFIIATANYARENGSERGAILFRVSLNSI